MHNPSKHLGTARVSQGRVCYLRGVFAACPPAARDSVSHLWKTGLDLRRESLARQLQQCNKP